MRLLFPMDAQNYDPAWRVFQRDSARAILLRGGRAAMIYSRKYAYYKFPGGGIEPSEAPVQALLRETEEEAGLRVLPQSIREYGCVRRIQKSDSGAAEIFRQDNLYYLCEAAEDTVCQRLDAYEADEGFTLEWVDPFHAITVNRRHAHGPADPVMLEREALVLEALIREAWLPSGDPQRLSPARLSSRYAVRPLTRTDIPAHYALSSRNMLFYEYHKPFVTEQSILEDLSALPPGKQAADKFYLGFFAGDRLAAVMDLILDYPERGIAFLGFFMMEPSLQGCGAGSAIIQECLAYLASMGFRKARLAIDLGNPQSRAFWTKNGFARTGESRPHGDSAYLPMERSLNA